MASRPSSSPTPIRAEVTALRDRPTADVLIIGGGINGIATFRELALQGVDVVLVERDDYVSGASSASSHMIHGGVRYLENGEFRLVKEAVTERNRLIRNAPHYVKPLQTTIPIFSTFSGILAAPARFLTHKQRTTTERGALLIKVGLVIYDSFSRDGGSVPRHRFLGRKRSLEAQPHLNPNVKFTATYYDASMHNPERLALDVLSDGLVTGDKARAANYVKAVGSDATGVRLRDAETGDEFTMTARVVINTSGPWTDLTNSGLGVETKFMGGTKGSHIVLDNPELLAAADGREMFFENDDGRIVLIYPLKGRVMIGTTDIDADPDEKVVCTEEEVDYFFDLVKHVFPKVALDRSQIVYKFSGIRPLPRHDDETPGFVSRDYRIERGELAGTPLLSLVGGKWTTFRALGEHMAGDALEILGAPHPVSTGTLAIGGGAGYPRDKAARSRWIAANIGSVDTDRADVLLERYGTRAADVIAALGADDVALSYAPDYSRAEIRYLLDHESVVHLSDLIYRRTSLAFVGGLSTALVDELGDLAAESLGWSAARKADEIRIATEDLAVYHDVHLKREEASATSTA